MKKYLLIVIVLLISLFFFFKFIKGNENNFTVYIESISDDKVTEGLGFVYKKENNFDYIVTNYHVIDKSFDIYIYNSKKEKIKANLFNYDGDADIAILIAEDKLNLKVAKSHNKKDIKLRDKVYACKEDNINKKLEGEIIDLFYDTNDIYGYNLIKTSIKTTYGNSGGPLLNKNGEVIGMISLMNEDTNEGYAIPIQILMDKIKEIESTKTINLGAVMANSDKIEGVVLVELDSNGILYKNEFKEEDIIVSFNNKNIKNIDDLKQSLNEYKDEETLIISYYRNGEIVSKIIDF